MESKLVELAALKAAFDHFTNKHWIPLQAVVIPFMNPSAVLAEGMGNLPLTNSDPRWLLPPYQLPSLSLCLTLDEGHPLPVLHPSLPSSAMSPPLSLTPPQIQTTCSLLQQECSKWCKDQMALYGPTKRGQQCKPSSPITKAKWESMLLFWRLEREIGLQEVLECFQKALDLGREEMEHDVMGC